MAITLDLKRNINKRTKNSPLLSINYINIIMNEQTVKLMAYLGTLCFLVMPYTISHNYGLFLFFAVSGNVLLLPQVLRAKQYNLVALNIIGGIGYLINSINLIIN
jgi:hypothetical protein